jgi:hypothetical protein
VSHAFGLPPRHDRIQRLKPKCPMCGGWDAGAAGFIMHKRDCPRHPCILCGLEVQATEKRTTFGEPPTTAHLDCAVDFEHDRDKEQHERG